jgi:hydrogenase maturation protease
MNERRNEHKKNLLVAIGNQDRQDDGAAWHLLIRLVKYLGRRVDPEIAGIQEISDTLSVGFAHQLTPELAPGLCRFDRVCFLDAHSGSIEENLRLIPLKPGLTASPFTHHFTPESCLAMCKMLKEKAPEAVLLSIRGYAFDFERTLSAKTEALLDEALNMLMAWLNPEKVSQP